MKCTSTPPEIDNHKHNILSPLVPCVMLIFRRKGLNRVNHRGTFSVSSNNNCYSLISIGLKYTFIWKEIRFNNSNVYLCLLKIIFDKFHFLWFPICVQWWIFKLQMCMVHLKKFLELVEVENEKWKCPHITYVKPLNEGFTIPLISFSSLLASSF